MDLYIGHNRPPFVEFGAELLPDFILRKDPNRCSEVRPRCSEPRTGSNALKRGQGALNAGRGDLNVRNNHKMELEECNAMTELIILNLQIGHAIRVVIL